MTELKVGETVRLKSGGPLMTVNHVHEDGDVVCKWFVGGTKLEESIFHPEAVMKAEPAKS